MKHQAFLGPLLGSGTDEAPVEVPRLFCTVSRGLCEGCSLCEDVSVSSYHTQAAPQEHRA